jgi:monoamine oxidase
MNRKHFILQLAGITGAGVLLNSCRQKTLWNASITGANAATGHMLRNPVSGTPDSETSTKVVIVGAGISGLSAARALYKKGVTDIKLIDLDNMIGGNAKWGENEISAYPCGAHYVPVPNASLPEYLDFLKEAGVITGADASGRPSFNEQYLCFDPEERLFINGRWQEGLVPQFGVPEEEKKQVDRFLKEMNHYRYLLGNDEKDAFAIPINRSSKDPSLTKLDEQTMQQWMRAQGYTSSYLHHYVNYCCRDDYGTTIESVSAWAGIHYYASRKGTGANAGYADVLTWPEGNGFLVKQLSKDLSKIIHTGCMATNVAVTGDKVHVTYYDTKTKRFQKIIAEQCIMAVPQYIVSKLIDDKKRESLVKENLHYVPWMVATLKINIMEERTGTALSWDNVLYDSNSLGFVDASHQSMAQHESKKNLVYYLPLTDLPPIEARKNAREKTAEEWTQIIIADLKKVYPDIEQNLADVKITVWGHAMAQPLPGLIHGNLRQELSTSINGQIHFANSDLAGISIFEEAFYQGISAAEKVITSTGKNSNA